MHFGGARPPIETRLVALERLCSIWATIVSVSAAAARVLPAVAGALAYDLGASMQAIATAAGIGRTTLHRHFPTRQDLTQAVAEYALLECDRLFDEAGIDGFRPDSPRPSGAAPAAKGASGGESNQDGDAAATPVASAVAAPEPSAVIPAREALDRLAVRVLPLANVYALLWADPPISSKVEVEAEVEARDARFEHFAKRGQHEGCFRSDVPSRWIVHSIGSQALAVGWAVRLGDVGAREAERLFRSTVVDGLGHSEAGS